MPTDAGSKKRYFWFAAGGVVVAALVAYLAMFWPPVPHSAVKGAIGQRNVYRQAQFADKDVGVAGQPKVTVDDLKKLVASREFRELAANANFQHLIGSSQFAAAAQLRGAAGVLANQNLQFFVKNQAYIILLQNASFQHLLLDSRFQSMMAPGAAANSSQLQFLIQQYSLQSSQQVVMQLLESSQFHSIYFASQQQLAQLISNSQFMQLLQSPGLQFLYYNTAALQFLQMPGAFALIENSQVQALCHQGQLQNLVNNAALQHQIFGAQGGLSAVGAQ
jgi:hypothetical protein